MHKIEEIVRSWASAIKSTEEEQERASERWKICSVCEHRKEAVFGSYCGKCGCALKAKIFTPIVPGCPEKKW